MHTLARYTTHAAFAAALAALVAAHSTASAEPWDGSRKFAAGLRLSGMTVTSTAGERTETGLGGLGLYGRYRISPRWEIEAAVDSLHGDLADGLHRDATAATLAGLLHLRPRSQWDVSLSLSLGAVHDAIRIADTDTVTAEFGESYVGLGIGVERRFSRWVVGAEFRVVGLRRGDAPDQADEIPADTAAARAGAAEPVPAESSAGQLILSTSYSF